MLDNTNKIQYRRLISIGFMGWVVVIAIDFFLHGGILAGLYYQSAPFLLPPEEAFRLIPLGYLSMLVQVTLLVWLVVNLKIETWKSGVIFGAKLGLLLGGSMFLGLLSISTLSWQYLLGMMTGQIVEFAAAGMVIGAGLRATKLRPILIRVIIFTILLLILTIAMQTFGLVPTLMRG